MINLVSNLISITINSIVLALMAKLRDVECKCIVDWRNTYIITYSSFMLLFAVVSLVYTFKKTAIPNKLSLAMILFFISIILNIYCLYSYTRDLELSQCNCISEKNTTIFEIVYYYIRISIILLICSLLFTFIGLLKM